MSKVNFFGELFDVFADMSSQDHSINAKWVEETGKESLGESLIKVESIGTQKAVSMAKNLDVDDAGYTSQDVGQAFKLFAGFNGFETGKETFTPKELKALSGGDIAVSAGDLGARGSDKFFQEMGMENLLNLDLENSKKFTIAFNLNVAKGTGGLEEIFPIIMLDCGQRSIEVTIEEVLMLDEFVTDTLTNKSRYGNKNILDFLSDPEGLDVETERFYPISNVTNDPFLYLPGAYTLTSEGQTFVTAPFLFDQDINLSEIGQTPNSLASHFNDEYTELDITLRTDKLYFNFNNGGVSNDYMLDVSMTPFANWTYTPQDSSDDLAMSTTIIFGVEPTTQAIGATSATPIELEIAKTLPAGGKMILSVAISGSANVETTMANLINGSVKLENALDGSGVPLASGPMATLKALVEHATNGVVLKGFELDGRFSSTAMRNNGIITRERRKIMRYYIEEKRPITQYKLDFTTCTGDSANNDVIKEVLLMKSGMIGECFRGLDRLKVDISRRLLIDCETGSYKSMGIGGYYFKPSYVQDAFDGVTDVRSIHSEKGLQDARGAISAKILKMSQDMITTTGYGEIKKAYEPSEKCVVYILVHNKQMPWIGDLNTYSNTPGVVYKIITHSNLKRLGSLYILLGTTNSNRLTTLSPFQCGNMVVSPSLVAANTRYSKNSAALKGISVIPLYQVIFNHGILGEIVLTNLGDLAGCCNDTTVVP